MRRRWSHSGKGGRNASVRLRVFCDVVCDVTPCHRPDHAAIGSKPQTTPNMQRTRVNKGDEPTPADRCLYRRLSLQPGEFGSPQWGRAPAEPVIETELEKAGVRLAYLLKHRFEVKRGAPYVLQEEAAAWASATSLSFPVFTS
jgi:hypothetical protein